MLSLLNPVFLVGAVTAAIPLALHLLHHKRARPGEWPSLKFLHSSQKRTAHRKRLTDLLLLVLRMALLAMLSVALAQPFLRNPEEGAATSIYLASSPDVTEVTGRYFVDGVPVESSPESYEGKAAIRLWESSRQLVGF